MDTEIEVNVPAVHFALNEALELYETALISNDVATLDNLFWTSEETVRFGATEVLFGHNEILEFRNSRPPKGLDRTVEKTAVTTFGTRFATASRTFKRNGEPRLGRQTQSWVYFGTTDGWKIVAAHVSWMD
ncbi:MAG: oxalurate catabolism protein HpxZ [Hyphomicrobiales bacterium]